MTGSHLYKFCLIIIIIIIIIIDALKVVSRWYCSEFAMSRNIKAFLSLRSRESRRSIV